MSARKHPASEKDPVFRQCPGCSYDFITGEGSRSCGWYDCPYLPEELKVVCPACNYNFATREGNPHCGTDPPTCEWAIEGYKHVRAAHRLFDTRS
ncbi:MAG: hypothetical protein ACXVQY_01620 [Actinomycetota bacterium]